MRRLAMKIIQLGDACPAQGIHFWSEEGFRLAKNYNAGHRSSALLEELLQYLDLGTSTFRVDKNPGAFYEKGEIIPRKCYLVYWEDVEETNQWGKVEL